MGWGVVHVSDQKTFTTHGPARIILSPKLYSWMVIFVREARSKVAGTTANPNSNVFLTWNGEPMVSSQINKAIKSVWKKAQVDGNPSSSLLRKSAVSRVHTASDSNEARGNLADLMAHILQTANKYYRLQEKSKSSVQASKQLRSIMREQSDHPDQTAKPNYFCQPKPICFRGCCPENLERFMERGQGSSYQDSFQG